MKALKEESDRNLLINAWMRQNAIDQLDDPETSVRQLTELYNKPEDRRRVTPRVIDRVGDFFSKKELLGLSKEKDASARKNKESQIILAINSYAAMLNKNPDFVSDERVDRLVELSKERNVDIRKIFLRRVCTPIKGLDELDRDVRGRIFALLDHPNEGVRKEARTTIEYRFGVSEKLSEEMLKFNSNQRMDMYMRMANLSWELDRVGLDAHAVFSQIEKMVKHIDKQEYSDVKFIIYASENLLGREGRVNWYNECLDKSYALYKEIGSKVGEGSKAFGEIVHGMFVERIPEMAMKMGYERLSKRLDEVMDEVKKQKPEVFAHSAFYVLEEGKLRV